jgi:hypothetical protein
MKKFLPMYDVMPSRSAISLVLHEDQPGHPLNLTNAPGEDEQRNRQTRQTQFHHAVSASIAN